MSYLRAEMKCVFPQFWAWSTNRVPSCQAVMALSSELAHGRLLGSVLTLGERESEFQPGVTQQGPGALLLLRLLLRSPLPPLQNERVGFRLGPWRLPKTVESFLLSLLSSFHSSPPLFCPPLLSSFFFPPKYLLNTHRPPAGPYTMGIVTVWPCHAKLLVGPL